MYASCSCISHFANVARQISRHHCRTCLFTGAILFAGLPGAEADVDGVRRLGGRSVWPHTGARPAFRLQKGVISWNHKDVHSRQHDIECSPLTLR